EVDVAAHRLLFSASAEPAMPSRERRSSPRSRLARGDGVLTLARLARGCALGELRLELGHALVERLDAAAQVLDRAQEGVDDIPRGRAVGEEILARALVLGHDDARGIAHHRDAF